MIEKNMSKKFLIEFFKDSDIEEKDGVLTVNRVSEDFENFIGKKAPYKFVFDIQTHNKVANSDLIMQGSYFLLAIRDYLENKGQTSLVKIQEIPVKSILSKLKGERRFYEFSFISTYQYLNDKKQTLNKFFVKDGKILDVDISKFKTQRGNKEDILNFDPSEDYQIAKKKLHEIITNDIKPIKNILKKKLEKELTRIKGHYAKQIKEKDDEVESCANKIRLLQSKLRHTSYERDRNIIMRMIRESNERLEMLKKRSYKERLKVEEEFHIKDEVEKHALAIKNNLINITVYYY
jgi:hypothetical protein